MSSILTFMIKSYKQFGSFLNKSFIFSQYLTIESFYIHTLDSFPSHLLRKQQNRIYQILNSFHLLFKKLTLKYKHKSTSIFFYLHNKAETLQQYSFFISFSHFLAGLDLLVFSTKYLFLSLSFILLLNTIIIAVFV